MSSHTFFNNVHCNIIKSLQRVCSRLRQYFITFTLQDDELLAARPTPKLEKRPLSSLRDFLFSIFAGILHIWRPSPPHATQGRAIPYQQDALIKGISYTCCGVLTKESMNTGRHAVGWALEGDSEHPCNQANFGIADVNEVTPTQQITILSSTN